MPKKTVSNKEHRQIIQLRARDKNKTEIADQVGVSRKTVDRHLEMVDQRCERSDNPEMALADELFDFDELLPFILEKSEGGLSRAIKNMTDLDFSNWLDGNDTDD
ncbi:helix-turn-helix domain-containing protein [Salinibaculum rarum]|uniref:helix-turn-helix domain-containing protein n=1 Tax=Salinibaculum rarum TaxID=3058903 RepID=UPI0026602713|nr:helix-turn-helix domain-containing protein [Salinibaculum sp. KK48]